MEIGVSQAIGPRLAGDGPPAVPQRSSALPLVAVASGHDMQERMNELWPLLWRNPETARRTLSFFPAMPGVGPRLPGGRNRDVAGGSRRAMKKSSMMCVDGLD